MNVYHALHDGFISFPFVFLFFGGFQGCFCFLAVAANNDFVLFLITGFDGYGV